MRPPESDPPRVLLYVFASSYLFDEAEQGLRAELAQMCQTENLRLLEIVVDRGPPKRRAADDPALARLASGEADAVLGGRSPLYRRTRPADRLEPLCPEGPAGGLPPAELKAARLLPKPRPLTPRPSAARRACETGA